MINYKQKYLKYKSKYLNVGGSKLVNLNTICINTICINLLWIGDLNKLYEDKQLLDNIIKWCEIYKYIFIWHDDDKNIPLFKDILNLQFVNINTLEEYLFTDFINNMKRMPLYFIIDYIKNIILYYHIQNQRYTYIIFSDLDIDPLINKLSLSESKMYDKINLVDKFEMILSFNPIDPNVEWENSFFIIKKTNITKSLFQIFINDLNYIILTHIGDETFDSQMIWFMYPKLMEILLCYKFMKEPEYYGLCNMNELYSGNEILASFLHNNFTITKSDGKTHRIFSFAPEYPAWGIISYMIILNCSITFKAGIINSPGIDKTSNIQKQNYKYVVSIIQPKSTHSK